MKRATPAKELELKDLDLGHLALFVGQALNERVQRELEAAGFEGLRSSHGYLFQHLLVAPRSVGELSQLMGVTQQAVSKVARELGELGYLDVSSGDDARVRLLSLSARGRAAVEASRELRKRLHVTLLRGHSAEKVSAARRLLAELLIRLGEKDAIEQRRVRAPESALPKRRRQRV